MREATAKVGWSDLMPVQAKAIPYVLDGRDLMVQSRTGSGKTGAFMLPIVERVDLQGGTCQAMVLVPTRELARQVARDAEQLGSMAGVKAVAVYGGVKYGPQIKALEKGAQVVVGTPGRILDLLLRRVFDLQNLDFLVFDEADRMLSIGFYPDMKQVQSYLPKRRVQSMMFSATYPPAVIRLAAQFLQTPDFLSLSKDHVHVAETEQLFYAVPGMEKERCLVRILEIENPTSAIVFCNTKANVEFVTTVLQRFGYDADLLTSDLSQGRREQVLTRVRNGKLRFLVATDLAARGIDIPDLSHVIQYEPPEDPEAYIHRAGRTGRAGASGTAITLVAGQEQAELSRIAARFHIDMQQREVPSDADVESIVSQRLTALMEARLRSYDNILRERIQRFVGLANDLAQHEEESALIAMLLDDYYQQSLHGQPPIPPYVEMPESSGRKKGGGRSKPGGQSRGGRSGRGRSKGKKRRD
ncbi:DEAD/DEAH box helicase [candidate division GN15 bacterium]|nr:DEAD/DEAH box helicase [candidate division GN15 bacterium]